MIVVHARVRSTPETRKETVAAMVEMQLASRTEDGCLSYTFVTDIDDDLRFTCVEEWRDLEALRAHFGTPHMAAYRAAVGPTTAGPTQISLFEAEPVNPDVLD